MSNRVLLNNVDHADLHVVPDFGAAHGAAANQLLIFPTEIEEAQRDFPIIFRKNADGEFRPLALLGLDRDENLFLEGDEWVSRSVPLIIQRGPFTIGLPAAEGGARAAGEPMVHVDLDDPRVGATAGVRVFREQGGNAPYLDHVTRVLQRIYQGDQLIGPMVRAFAEAALIEESRLNIQLDEQVRYQVPDCFTISQQRLATLAGDQLERLHKSGFLRLAILISSSLGNIPQLIERKNRRRRAAEGQEPVLP